MIYRPSVFMTGGFTLHLKNENAEITIPYLRASFKKRGEIDLRLAKAVFEPIEDGIYVRRVRLSHPTQELTVIQPSYGIDCRIAHSVKVIGGNLEVEVLESISPNTLGCFGYGKGELALRTDSGIVTMQYHLDKTTLREFDDLRRSCSREVLFPYYNK
jgi:hypothetical protein